MANYSMIVAFIFFMVLFPSTSFAELKDPTRPQDLQSVSHAGTLVLNAIMIGPSHRLAVIDDKIVHEGDEFDGIKVTAIHKDSVDLDGADGKVTIPLFATIVKTPVQRNERNKKIYKENIKKF